MNNGLHRFLKLFDRTFFRMSFQFLAIIFVAFLIMLAVGAFEAGGGNNSVQAGPTTTQR